MNLGLGIRLDKSADLASIAFNPPLAIFVDAAMLFNVRYNRVGTFNGKGFYEDAYGETQLYWDNSKWVIFSLVDYLVIYTCEQDSAYPWEGFWGEGTTVSQAT